MRFLPAHLPLGAFAALGEAAPLGVAPPSPRAAAGPRPVVAEPEIGTEAETEEEIATKHGEGWAVILYNDEVNEMIYVVLAIRRATGFELEQAWNIMLEAHRSGKAVVTITSKDEAEKVVSLLRTAKLTAELRQV